MVSLYFFLTLSSRYPSGDVNAHLKPTADRIDCTHRPAVSHSRIEHHCSSQPLCTHIGAASGKPFRFTRTIPASDSLYFNFLLKDDHTIDFRQETSLTELLPSCAGSDVFQQLLFFYDPAAASIAFLSFLPFTAVPGFVVFAVASRKGSSKERRAAGTTKHFPIKEMVIQPTDYASF